MGADDGVERGEYALGISKHKDRCPAQTQPTVFSLFDRAERHQRHGSPFARPK